MLRSTLLSLIAALVLSAATPADAGDSTVAVHRTFMSTALGRIIPNNPPLQVAIRRIDRVS